MPSGEDVTGLHAFDDLDPVSTVSALSAMPEPEMVLPQQVPQRVHMPSTMPPPPPARAGGPLPPPPRGGLGGRSVPPSPPGRVDLQAHDSQEADDEESFEDTRLMPQDALDYGAEFDDASVSEDDDSVEPGVDAASTGRNTAIDDTELLELSATTVATKIEMDWDEDDAETKLRDEGEPGMASSSPMGRPSPFPPPMTSSAPFAGNPSPFGQMHSSFPPPAIVAPEHDEWEDDEDARTRVMLAPSFPPPPTMPRFIPQPSTIAYTPEPSARAAQTLVGKQSFVEVVKSNPLTWMGFAAVGLIAAAVVTRALTAGSDLATVTLEIEPSDSQVIVDGHLLTGTSPFTVQELEPGVPHTLEVHKDGYATQKQPFTVTEGEVKPLPGVRLAPLRVDTGFAISSTPAGAAVYVDGHKLAQVTPARVTDLSSGLHVVRLEYAGGYQPWETQVALGTGQVIELPNARLVASGPTGQRSQPSQVASAPAAKSSSSSSSGSSRRHRDSARASSPAAAPVAFASPAPSRSAPVAAASGSQGTLRVNSRPWSQVFVDGRMLGNTPQLNIPLGAGKHKVKLVNPQLGMNKTFEVAIQSGKSVTKIVDLE